MLNEVGFFVRSIPRGTAFMVMSMFAVVGMVSAPRHHVPDLVHELQSHHKRPRRQQHAGRNPRQCGGVMGLNHGDGKASSDDSDVARVEANLWNFKAWPRSHSVALAFQTFFKRVERNDASTPTPGKLLAF